MKKKVAGMGPSHAAVYPNVGDSSAGTADRDAAAAQNIAARNPNRAQQIASGHEAEPEWEGRGNGRSAPRRAWFIVLNNPRNYLYHWYMTQRQTPTVNIKTMPQADLAIAIAKTICPEGSEEDIGVSVNVEEGNQTGTEHCHIVMYIPKGMRFKAVKALFFGMAHIEQQQGTKKEAEDYLNKRGKWENDPKGHTLKVPPFHLGLSLGDNRSGSSDTVDRLNDLTHEMANAGVSPSAAKSAVSAMGLEEARYADRVAMMMTALAEQRAISEGRVGAAGERMFVVWHFGKSGTGKTFSLRDLMREEMTCYLIDPSTKDHPWDNYVAQPMVCWDEFRDTAMAYDAALSMLNREGRGTQRMDARYFAHTIAYCRFDLTSINPPERQWVKMRAAREADGQDEPLYQLVRRIDLICYHFVDRRFPKGDPRHYCAVAMPGGHAYKHSDQLERRAKAYLEDPYTGPQTEIALSVDKAAGASFKEKDAPLLLGPADEVERNIRRLMWDKYADDPYRDSKLSFLGLTDEEKVAPLKNGKMVVVDNSTIGQPRTEQLPMATSGVPRPAQALRPDPLATMAAARGVDPSVYEQTEQPSIRFGETGGQDAAQKPKITFTYDQHAEVPMDVYESFAYAEDDGRYDNWGGGG